MCRWCNGKGWYKIVSPSAYATAIADETYKAMGKQEKSEFLDKIGKVVPCQKVVNKYNRVMHAEAAVANGEQSTEQGEQLRAEDSRTPDPINQEAI